MKVEEKKIKLEHSSYLLGVPLGFKPYGENFSL
jgi:hypothetical protein